MQNRRRKSSKSQRCPMTSSRHNISPQRLCQKVQDIHKFKPDKISTSRKENGHKVLMLINKLFVINSYWDKENQFSPMECQYIYQPHSQLAHAQEQLANTKWILEAFVYFSGFVLIYFCLNYFLVCFDFYFWICVIFLIVVCWGRKKVKLGGEGCVEDLGRIRGQQRILS